MAKVKLRYIENVEGKQHLNFIEGRKLMQSARADLRNSIFSLLLFCALIFLFIIISGFNFFYIGFLVAFLVIFTLIYFKFQCLLWLYNNSCLVKGYIELDVLPEPIVPVIKKFW